MGESREQGEAFVTLSTNDTYTLGCLVLGNSLRHVGTTRKLVVMITDGVSHSMREQLRALFDLVVEVNVLDSSDTCNLDLLGRPDLSVTFTKLHCWRLTQFTKCVFMDADTLVLQNVDDLFDRDELSASPDAGWPDCFNSGVFVFRPSQETYVSLLQMAVSHGSFDGGDQGLLNLYFTSWATADIGKHLPFTYNVVSQAFYSYLPAFKQFQDQIKIVHFIGAVKPWHHPFSMNTRRVTALPDSGHNQRFLQIWWNIFMDAVHPHLDTQLREVIGSSDVRNWNNKRGCLKLSVPEWRKWFKMTWLQISRVGYRDRNRAGGLVGDLAKMSMSDPNIVTMGDRERRLQWEHGQADYLGIDRFDNIRARLDSKINETGNTKAMITDGNNSSSSSSK